MNSLSKQASKQASKHISYKGIFVLLLICVFIIGILGTAFLYKKWLKHENAQNARISNLQNQLNVINENIKRDIEYYKYEVNYPENTYNYLALGNSLTLIESENRGVWASQEDSDYYGLLVKALKEKYGGVFSTRYNFSLWETSADRDSLLTYIDCFLDEKLNLVTLQLGENVSDTSRYEANLITLVDYIKRKAPKARIIVVGDFWDKNKSDKRRNASKMACVDFADINEIGNRTEYQAKNGDIIYYSNGATHIVNAGAGHPNDEGFRYIADRIIEKLEAH